MTTDTTDSPRWVHRLGTVFASLTITTLLFYVVFSFRLHWFLSDSWGMWRIEDVGQDGFVWLFISALAALIFVPAAYAALAGLRRLGVRARYAWTGVGVASIALLIGIALLAGGPGGSAATESSSDTLGFLAVLASFGVTVAAGTWAGRAVTRIETPLQNRRLLAVGAVLIALVVAPTVIAMAVEEPEPDTFDPGTDGEYQDDPAWNESEGDLDETNNGTDDTTGGGDTENDHDSVTELTLGEARCREPLDGVRETPGFNHSTAANGTLSDDLRVEYIDFDDGRIYSIQQWNDTEVVEVAADGPAGKSYAVDYLGEVDVVMGDAPARLWIDVVNDDGEVVRYQVDLCPPPES